MKHLRTFNSRPKAFTLLEMMVVLLIIALIIGSVAVMVQGIEGNAQQVTTSGKIKALETALTSYKISNLVYPTQEQGLEALVTRPTAEPKPRRWNAVMKADGLIDPWGRKCTHSGRTAWTTPRTISATGDPPCNDAPPVSRC
jgi:general secretion pathway protein G